MFTLISLSPWGAEPYTIALYVFLQALSFSLLMRRKREPFLMHGGELFVGVSVLGLIVLSLIDPAVFDAGASLNRSWASALAAFAGLAYFAYSRQKFTASAERAVESLAIGPLPLALYANLLSITSGAEGIAAGMIALFIVLRVATQTNWIQVGALISLLGVTATGWIRYGMLSADPDYLRVSAFSLGALVPLVLSIRSSD